MYPNTFQHVRLGGTLAATLTGLGALAAGGSPAVNFNPAGVGSKLATATDTFSDASTSAIPLAARAWCRPRWRMCNWWLTLVTWPWAAPALDFRWHWWATAAPRV